MLFTITFLIFFIFYSYEIQFSGAICLGFFLFGDRKNIQDGIHLRYDKNSLIVSLFFVIFLILSVVDGKTPQELINFLAISLICLFDIHTKKERFNSPDFEFLILLCLEIFVILSNVLLEGSFWAMVFPVTFLAIYGSGLKYSLIRRLFIYLNTILVITSIVRLGIFSMGKNSLVLKFLNGDSGIMDKYTIILFFLTPFGLLLLNTSEKQFFKMHKTIIPSGTLSQEPTERNKIRLTKYSWANIFEQIPNGILLTVSLVLFFLCQFEFSDFSFTIFIVFSFIRIVLEKKAIGGAIESQSRKSLQETGNN